MSFLIAILNWPLSFFASVLRLGAGAAGEPVDVAQPVVLYEFEGCPFCRIAREAVSESGVTVEVRPCPKGGERFRPDVERLGGKAQFPYMIDPNTDVTLYESADIARYFRKTYGPRRRPPVHWLGPFNLMLSQFAVLARFMSGTFSRRASAPSRPLRFYGAERSPGARLVKERLCAMQLTYIWRSRAPEGGGAPRLIDKNTGDDLLGAAAILSHLAKEYKP
ncbi:MAG: glutathione S-transferase N-terminal domain-containing protein [Pseudomonadota bacterium]